MITPEITEPEVMNSLLIHTRKSGFACIVLLSQFFVVLVNTQYREPVVNRVPNDAEAKSQTSSVSVMATIEGAIFQNPRNVKLDFELRIRE